MLRRSVLLFRGQRLSVCGQQALRDISRSSQRRGRFGREIGSSSGSMHTEEEHPSMRNMQLSTRSLSSQSSSNPNAAGGKTRRHVRHILVPPDQHDLHEQLQKELEEGGDFESLARKHSVCPSAARGGDVGWMMQGLGLPLTFEEAMLEADIGENATAETKKGLHIIQVLDESKEVEVQKMSVEVLSLLLHDKTDAQLIDVREENEHAVAKLPDFMLLPLSRIQEWAPTLTQNLDKDKMTVCLCHHGVRSSRMADMLLAQGFTNVHNVEGGIDAYSNIDSSIPRY